MKLYIPLVNGTTLAYEGTYDELAQIGEQYVAKCGTLIGPGPSPDANVQPHPQPTPIDPRPVTPSRRWTEQTVRKLWGLLYGEQAKVVKFLVERGGTAKYADLTKHLGYRAQNLSGILSPLTRNAQTATGDRLARLIDWRIPDDGKREYYVDPDALHFLQQILQHP